MVWSSPLWDSPTWTPHYELRPQLQALQKAESSTLLHAGGALIEAKPVSVEAPGHPKSTQNRSGDPFGTPSRDHKRSGSDSGGSRERLGTSPARPGRARRLSKDAPERQKEFPGASGSALRRPKSRPSRVRERVNRFLSHGSFAKHRQIDFSSILADF